VGLLNGLGYQRVRDYVGGLADWRARGGKLVTAPPPRRNSRARGWAAGLIEALEQAKARDLFQLGLLLVLGSAILYGLAGLVPGSGLVTREGPGSWLDTLYFSLSTATTLGYGDVTPIGLARGVAVLEALAGLLLFGALISKFLSKRQETMVEELHRLSFEDRIGRVQTNLHLVIRELQDLSAACTADDANAERLRPRLEGAVLIFTSELRAIHDLLHRPQVAPEETVLEGLLAGLSAAMAELERLLNSPAAIQARGPLLERSLAEVTRLARDICGDCVPLDISNSLRGWMDRVQGHARDLSP
jgi:Ion channel